MAFLRLPRTHGCLVCGRDNPRGLQLELSVDEASGVVEVEAVFTKDHVGFTNVLHGGAVATVADEAMVWAATWAGKRFCLCGELTVRYLRPAHPGIRYRYEAKVESRRSRLIVTSCRLLDESGQLVATASAKYLPVSAEEHAKVVETFIREEASDQAARALANA